MMAFNTASHNFHFTIKILKSVNRKKNHLIWFSLSSDFVAKKFKIKETFPLWTIKYHKIVRENFSLIKICFNKGGFWGISKIWNIDRAKERFRRYKSHPVILQLWCASLEVKTQANYDWKIDIFVWKLKIKSANSFI